VEPTLGFEPRTCCLRLADQRRELRRDSATWLGRTFAGHSSFAGAQAKTALVFDGKRWGRPAGAIPMTHIIKPDGTGFADHDVTEHLSLSAASRAGIFRGSVGSRAARRS
jgi:serine/threonine-protein kinase HipA